MADIIRRNCDFKPLMNNIPTQGACKIPSINNEFIGALLPHDTNQVNRHSNCIPIFYSDNYSKTSLKMANSVSGNIIEVDAVIHPLPSDWINIIVPSSDFIFDKGNNIGFTEINNLMMILAYYIRNYRYDSKEITDDVIDKYTKSINSLFQKSVWWIEFELFRLVIEGYLTSKKIGNDFAYTKTSKFE